MHLTCKSQILHIEEYKWEARAGNLWVANMQELKYYLLAHSQSQYRNSSANFLYKDKKGIYLLEHVLENTGRAF